MEQIDIAAGQQPASVSLPVSIRAGRSIGHASRLRVREADLPDVERLVALVNAAYRPAAGRGGWTDRGSTARK